MQSKRNRRIMLAQDIIFVCLLPILGFLCLGSLQVGEWNTGDMFSITPSTEIMETCLEDFYTHYINSTGNELGDVISYSPWGFWKDVGRGAFALGKGLIHHTVDTSHLADIPADVFAEAAPLLFPLHLIWDLLQSSLFQGLIYLALFSVNACIPFICIPLILSGLVNLLKNLRHPEERHKSVTLSYRHAVRPFFTVLLLTLMLPDTQPAMGWVYCIGLYLISLIWNFIASRVKRNTFHEKEFLNFIQFTSLGGIALTIGCLVALNLSGLLNLIYERIYYADGLEIILDAIDGNFNSSKILFLIITALFLAGIGLTVRYIYYGLLKVSCMLVNSKHMKVHKEGMVAVAAVTLCALASAFLMTESSGRMEITLEDSSFIAYCVALGLSLLVLILEIVQRVLCHLNCLGREYRDNLLAGCTEDRLYSDETTIAPLAEDSLSEKTPVEEAPMEEAPVEEAPVEEAPVEEAPVEEAPVEEAPVEEAPVEEAPVEEAPVEEAPVEEAPVEEFSTADTPAEGTTEEE